MGTLKITTASRFQYKKI